MVKKQMNTLSTKAIVVDDDPEIRDLVKEYLTDEGFVVDEAPDGAALRVLIEKNVPDIILLDLKLPGDDGLTLAREIRQKFPSVGIVMISGKEDVVDRVAGLEVGADDYITKPFHLRELLARIRSVLRRRDNGQNGRNGETPSTIRTGAESADTQLRHIMQFSDWVLDGNGRKLFSMAGTPVELTGGEFDLLVAFVSHPNRALSRDQLLDYARSRETEAFDRSIDVQVGRLRRKIEQDPKRPALIKTIRNVGYMFSADVTVVKN